MRAHRAQFRCGAANRIALGDEQVGMNRTSSPRRPLLVLAATASLLLVACGGDDDTATTVAPTATSAADDDAGSAATGDASAENTIVITDFAFTGVSEVAVGTTVVVRNDDSAEHTWSSVDGLFNSGPLAEGDTFEFTFTEPGTFAYLCNFHPSMSGTITVTG